MMQTKKKERCFHFRLLLQHCKLALAADSSQEVLKGYACLDWVASSLLNLQEFFKGYTYLDWVASSLLNFQEFFKGYTCLDWVASSLLNLQEVLKGYTCLDWVASSLLNLHISLPLFSNGAIPGRIFVTKATSMLPPVDIGVDMDVGRELHGAIHRATEHPKRLVGACHGCLTLDLFKPPHKHCWTFVYCYLQGWKERELEEF